MSRYQLLARSPGETFHRIMDGSRWAGRVLQHNRTKLWMGVLGPVTVEGFETCTQAYTAVITEYQRLLRLSSRKRTQNVSAARYNPQQRLLDYKARNNAPPINTFPDDPIEVLQGLKPKRNA